MGLLTYIGGLTTVTVVYLWTATRMALGAYQTERAHHIDALTTAYLGSVTLMTAYTFLDGIVHFATALWNFVL